MTDWMTIFAHKITLKYLESRFCCCSTIPSQSAPNNPFTHPYFAILHYLHIIKVVHLLIVTFGMFLQRQVSLRHVHWQTERCQLTGG